MSYIQRMVRVFLLAGIVAFAPVSRALADDGQAVVASGVEWVIDWGSALWTEITASLGALAPGAESPDGGGTGDRPVSASPYIDPRG